MPASASLRLATALSARATAAGRVLPVLVQVNTSREPQKHGAAPDEAEELVRGAAALDGIEVRGLMTMAAIAPDPEETRPAFAALRETMAPLAALDIPGARLTELSMGMTQDYEVAIEEGATCVRVGSALFRGVA